MYSPSSSLFYGRDMGLMEDSLSFRVPMASSMARALFDDVIGKWHRGGHCWVSELCLKVESMFRMCSIQYLSTNVSHSWSIVCWEWSRISRTTPCFPCWRSFPSTSRWTEWTRAFVVGLLVVLLCSGDSRTDESISGLPVRGFSWLHDHHFLHTHRR